MRRVEQGAWLLGCKQALREMRVFLWNFHLCTQSSLHKYWDFHIWQSLLSVLSVVYIFNRKLGYRNHCYPGNIKRGRKKERTNVGEEQANTRERGSAKECENKRQGQRERWEVKGKTCADKRKDRWEHRGACEGWWKGGRREEERGQGWNKGGIEEEQDKVR